MTVLRRRRACGVAGWLRVATAASSFPAAWSTLSRRKPWRPRTPSPGFDPHPKLIPMVAPVWDHRDVITEVAPSFADLQAWISSAGATCWPTLPPSSVHSISCSARSIGEGEERHVPLPVDDEVRDRA